MSLTNKKILLCITGSIAAYKSILLVRLLKQQHCEVKVVLTPAASTFVSPLVLETLSGNHVYSELAHESEWSNHVMMARWADLIVIAPATCNTIAHLAQGICNNLVHALYLSAVCKVLVAPAMDEDMWKHPTTRRNINQLHNDGVLVTPVAKGELASGLNGEGRMLEPEDLLDIIRSQLVVYASQLKGKKALVTAGPTYEAIDPVRFVGNYSTGLMGIEIARSLASNGVEVELVLGPTNLSVPPSVKVTRVTTANEMFETCRSIFPGCDLAVMTAAVADYRPDQVATEKVKKVQESFQLNLVRNPDILRWCGQNKTSGQVVVGFALETENEEENARKKLIAKNADLIVLNSLRHADAGFGKPTNRVKVFSSNGDEVSWPALAKADVADHLVELIAKQFNEKN